MTRHQRPPSPPSPKWLPHPPTLSAFTTESARRLARARSVSSLRAPTSSTTNKWPSNSCVFPPLSSCSSALLSPPWFHIAQLCLRCFESFRSLQPFWAADLILLDASLTVHPDRNPERAMLLSFAMSTVLTRFLSAAVSILSSGSANTKQNTNQSQPASLMSTTLAKKVCTTYL